MTIVDIGDALGLLGQSRIIDVKNQNVNSRYASWGALAGFYGYPD